MKKNFSTFDKRDWKKSLLTGLVIGLISAIALSFGILETWSKRVSDRLYLPYTADERIVIVAIDDASMARLGRWPWDRSVHAELISKIAEAGVLAIGYDVNFPEPQDEENDMALANAIKKAGNVVLPVELELLLSKNEETRAKLILPSISLIASVAGGIGHTNTPQDADGVVRKVPLTAILPDGSIVPAFSYRVLELAGISIPLIKGVDASNRLLIHYPNAPGLAFPIISASDIMDKESIRAGLENKIVFVGATAPNLHDYQRVPTSITLPMSGVEVHASMATTLLQQKYLYEIPKIIMIIWLILIGVFTGLLLAFIRVRWSVPLIIFLWLASVIVAFICFDKGFIVDILWITLAFILSFAGVALERKIAAEKQKRELKLAFSHYVSSSVVDSIMQNPSKLQLGGIRKNMTVLFSDVRGFTTISEGLKPEELVYIMNTYLTRMTDIVFKHEGVLDKYIGDAVMAFWNAPFDQKDHAKRAVDTALEMLSELKIMNQEKLFGDFELKIGIGINTGDMVVGNMGSHNRFDYTVIGDSVNLGSRMEGLTKQYGIELLISESVKEQLPKGEYLIRQIDLVAVKGKNKPVKMYEVMKKAIDASDDDKQLIKEFTQALHTYSIKDFSATIKITDNLMQKYPNDGPVKTLNERSKVFLNDPPPNDWDGVWIMKTK